MSVQLGTGPYNTGATNTNRTKRFRVAVQAGVSDRFVFLKGDEAFYPYIGAIASPTVNQKAAQERINAIVRGLTVYAPLVSLKVVDFDQGGSETNNALEIEFETAQSNVLPSASDIVDTLGQPGTDKTKPGLQTLATALVAGYYLGGTLLFAVNPNLADGTATTAGVITTLTVTAL